MNRRTFLVFTAAGVAAACAAPAPSPTTAPPTAPPAQPTTPPAATKPAAAASPKAAAPAPTAAPKVAPTARPLTKAVLAFPAASITASVFQVGRERGFFREEGVDLELQQVPSANAIKAMLAGEIQFTSAAGTALASIVSGAPMKLILISTHGPVAWLYAGSSIKSIADLKGKSVAIAAPGDFSHNLARIGLAHGGLNPDTDVSYAAVPGASRNRLQAVLAGSVDAAVMTPPENLIADQEGLNQLLFMGDKVKLSTDGAATTDDMIKEKPEVVKGFVRGGVKALISMKQNKAATVPILASFMNVEPAQAAGIYDSAIGGFSEEGFEQDDTLIETIADQKRLSQVDRAFALPEVFNLSFAKQASQDLRSSGWKG